MLKRLFWLMLGAFAIGTESFVIAGILPDVSRDLQVSISQAGQLVVAFSLTYGLATPVLAVLTAAWPRERVLRLAMAGFVVGNVGAALAGGFFGLLAARIALALCAGLYMGTASAYAAASVEPERRGRALSLLYLGMNAATILGVPLGTLIGHLYGWRSTFAMVGAIALLAWLGLCLPRAPQALQPAPGLRERLRIAAQAPVLLGLATTLLCFAGIFSMYTYLAPLLTTVGGLPEHSIAIVLLLFGFAGSAGNLFGGRMADRIGPMPVIGAALSLLSLVYAAFALVAHALPSPAAGYAMVGLVVLWGFIGWSFAPAQQLAFVRRAPNAVSVVLSLNASALYLGISLGASIGAMAVAAGALRSIGAIGAVCLLLALAAARWGQASVEKKGRAAHAASPFKSSSRET
jgi:predicted MFS family arabinose efflux permease